MAKCVTLVQFARVSIDSRDHLCDCAYMYYCIDTMYTGIYRQWSDISSRDALGVMTLNSTLVRNGDIKSLHRSMSSSLQFCPTTAVTAARIEYMTSLPWHKRTVVMMSIDKFHMHTRLLHKVWWRTTQSFITTVYVSCYCFTYWVRGPCLCMCVYQRYTCRL